MPGRGLSVGWEGRRVAVCARTHGASAKANREKKERIANSTHVRGVRARTFLREVARSDESSRVRRDCYTLGAKYILRRLVVCMVCCGASDEAGERDCVEAQVPFAHERVRVGGVAEHVKGARAVCAPELADRRLAYARARSFSSLLGVPRTQTILFSGGEAARLELTAGMLCAEGGDVVESRVKREQHERRRLLGADRA